MNQLVCNETNKSPAWGLIDVAIWKLLKDKWGGGIPYIQKFKNGWVKHNKTTIILAAKEAYLPAEFLAGVCWIEVGGDPEFIDRVAFEVRAFDWSGPKWIDKNLTSTSPPQKTSFGQVSMQLRTAAQTMGLDLTKITDSDYRQLARCLQTDVFNIKLVARHLRELVDHDLGQCSTVSTLTTEQIRFAGARYNRGIGLSLSKIKENTSYGDFIIKIIPKMLELLK